MHFWGFSGQLQDKIIFFLGIQSWKKIKHFNIRMSKQMSQPKLIVVL